MFIQSGRPAERRCYTAEHPALAQDAMDRLTLGGFGLRLVAALGLVVATYNPAGLSYVHWLSTTFPRMEPLQAVAGLALLGGWAFCGHATWRSLGAFGLLLGAALCAAVVWLITSWGWISLHGASLAWILVLAIGVLLAVGLSWSIVERRATGQVVVDEGEHH
jgi:hypothetical protein